MSAKEFWEDAPELLWAYRKSYMDKIKIERDIMNYKAWLNGLYVNNAVAVVIYNSFGRKEGQKVESYISKPYDFSKTEKQLEQERILKVEAQIKERLRQSKEILNKRKVGET